MSLLSRSLSSPSPRDPQALDGYRRRARKLGILEEFCGLVSEGDVSAAMGRLALAEQRVRRRRERIRRGFLAASLGATLGWHVALRVLEGSPHW